MFLSCFDTLYSKSLKHLILLNEHFYESFRHTISPGSIIFSNQKITTAVLILRSA